MNEFSFHVGGVFTVRSSFVCFFPAQGGREPGNEAGNIFVYMIFYKIWGYGP